MKFFISRPYRRRRRTIVFYTFILDDFWAKVGLKVLFIILSI